MEGFSDVPLLSCQSPFCQNAIQLLSVTRQKKLWLVKTLDPYWYTTNIQHCRDSINLQSAQQLAMYFPCGGG